MKKMLTCEAPRLLENRKVKYSVKKLYLMKLKLSVNPQSLEISASKKNLL
jgi:hypothetical protein